MDSCITSSFCNNVYGVWLLVSADTWTLSCSCNGHAQQLPSRDPLRKQLSECRGGAPRGRKKVLSGIFSWCSMVVKHCCIADFPEYRTSPSTTLSAVLLWGRLLYKVSNCLEPQYLMRVVKYQIKAFHISYFKHFFTIKRTHSHKQGRCEETQNLPKGDREHNSLH